MDITENMMTKRVNILLTALAAALLTTTAMAETSNPFTVDTAASFEQVNYAKDSKCGEGKCGGEMKKHHDRPAGEMSKEGKCGADMKKHHGHAAEGMSAEGKCGADMKKHHGHAAGEMSKEGKCGADMKKHHSHADGEMSKEGKCGAEMKKAH